MNPYYNDQSAQEMNQYPIGQPISHYPNFNNNDQPYFGNNIINQNYENTMNQNYFHNMNPMQNNENYCKICCRLTHTKINYKFGSAVWISFILLIFIGLALCSWIPFVVKQAKDKQFVCIECNTIKRQKKVVNFNW